MMAAGGEGANELDGLSKGSYDSDGDSGMSPAGAARHSKDSKPALSKAELEEANEGPDYSAVFEEEYGEVKKLRSTIRNFKESRMETQFQKIQTMI